MGIHCYIVFMIIVYCMPVNVSYLVVYQYFILAPVHAVRLFVGGAAFRVG